MSEFDPEASERRNSEKPAALHIAIQIGDRGPAEPLNMEAILAESHADYQRRNEARMRLPQMLADLKSEAYANGLAHGS